MMVAKFFWILISAFQVKGYCSTEKCEKISFDEQQDAYHDKELVGHVFYNSVTSNPQQCYLWCIHDCRCLSINYKVKNDIKYCELNEGSHFTNKNSLKNVHGSVYYVLRREYSVKASTNIVPYADDFTCTNGCCKNSPCLNRGTCTEIYQPTSVRYNCSCPVPFVGKHCEIQQKRSCHDYKAAGSIASGLYTVNDDINQTFQVFCDFDSEPGFAWNLIESFSLSNKHRFQENIVVYDDYQAISGDAPNWRAYLIKRPYLIWLRDHSTHWRATCRYNTDGTVYTDYLRASLEDFDIIKDVPTVVDICRSYEYVNIRGSECVNCTVFTGYKKGIYPLHVDSYFTHRSCDFDASKMAINDEDNFGMYSSTNPKFRCTTNSGDTTQFSIGGK